MKKLPILRSGFAEGGLLLAAISVFADETKFSDGTAVEQIDGGAE